MCVGVDCCYYYYYYYYHYCYCYYYCTNVCVQDGIVLWYARSSQDCRVGLTVTQELADAIRCVHS